MIRFFEEDIRYRLLHKRKTKSWLVEAIRKEGYGSGDINIIFCSDKFLYEYNVKYLNHNTLTDIITFDLSDSEDIISSDIYISIERAKDNSQTFKTVLIQEVRRLMIHGILHLCGHPDKTPAEKAVIREKEDYYLSLHP